MQLELSRLTRKTFAQTNYDATACYDRILLPNLTVLDSRVFGVPKEVTASNARTLEKASYHVRTDFGMASEGYPHTEEAPISGTGQGSGISPAIRCFLSSLLYQCYDRKAMPATYCCPHKSIPVVLGMVGFVDDSNGQTSNFMVPETSETVVKYKTLYKKTRSIGQISWAPWEVPWSFPSGRFIWLNGSLQHKVLQSYSQTKCASRR